MKPTIQLDGKDVRQIIALFLNVPLEDVIPNRYGFSVANINVEVVKGKLNGGETD